MRWHLILAACITASLLIPAAFAANATLVYSNGTNATDLLYDRADTTYNVSYPATYGADAYLDQSPTNADVYVDVCHPDLRIDDRIDLRFVSEEGNLTWSLLQYLPRVDSLTPSGSENCTRVDPEFSSLKSLYPGEITPMIVRDNGTNTTIISDYEPFDQILNGSYDIGIEVRGPPKAYYITIDRVLDENGLEITRNEPQMITSIVAANGTVMDQDIVSKDDFILFDGSFQGGEKIFVNGLLSLEVKVYEPCEPFNESGYYILNKSKNNYNETCIVIENQSNIVLNFVGEQIDGDNLENGSRAEYRCPIDVRNSRSITFENLKTSEYRYGICVRNSTVSIFGQSSSFHETGALIENNSDVLFVDTQIVLNDKQDINASGRSRVRLYDVNFSSARINSTFEDSIVRPVPNPPNPPNITEIVDIGQWIRYDRNGADAWAQVGFKYEEPLPNDAVVDNVSIFKYNGTYELIDNGTGPNATVQYNWTNGTWTQLFTLVAPQVQVVFAENVSNFSVFAPYAFESNQAEPDPVPEPQPEPQSGSSSGGGGSPTNTVDQPDTEIFPEPVELELELPENVTLRQGEAGEVEFNLTNVGETSAINITIETDVPRDWDVANYSLDVLEPGDRVSDSYPLAPSVRATPREYYVPVSVYVDSSDGSGRQRVLRDVLRVIVLPRGDLYRLKVLEYPPVIRMNPNSRQDVSFLTRNIGDNALDGIEILYEETECLTDISGSGSLDVEEEAALTYTFRSAGPNVCDYILKFQDAEGRLVGFVPVTFLIQQAPLISNPLSFSILLIILAAWTMLSVWIIRRRRY